MLVNRFSDYFAEQPVMNQSRMTFNQTEAFVPCPMMGQYSVAQQEQIAEVYRLAHERTVAQLKEQSLSRRYDFSCN